MIFHIFICILQILRVYYELTRDQLPDGLIAQSVEHCTGIESRSGLSFFQALISQLLKPCVQLR